MKKTPGEFAYESWCRNAGVEVLSPMERAKRNNFVDPFFELMKEHCIQGYFRYGTVRTYRERPTDFVARIRNSCDLFEKDGNIEHFIDIANWASFGFHYTDHPKRHYAVADKKR